MKAFIDFLAKKYGPPIRQREPKEPATVFKIDDENTTDFCESFCQICVTTIGPTELRLQLTACPLTWELQHFVEDHDGVVDLTPLGNEIRLKLSVKQVTAIRNLARQIRSIVGRGRRYSNPNWKWICRRTADSLDRFAEALMDYRRLADQPDALRSSSEIPRQLNRELGDPSSSVSHHQATDGEDINEPDLFQLLGME